MAQPAEFGKEKDLEITLMDSDGKSLGALRAETTVPTPEGGRRAYIELILGLNNVPFQHPGDYEFAILVDGEQKGTIPIEVVERKPEVQA
jgi:hypothetical protein